MLQLLFRGALATAAMVALCVPVASAEASPTADRPLSKRWAEITRVEGGFHYEASPHDNNVSITRVGNRVVFRDTAARRFRKALPRGCRRIQAAQGIAASCRIPATATEANPLLLEIVPQAGNDRVDGSTLAAELRLSVEPGPGDDTTLGGAADDLINGALGNDHADGGEGEDLIRTGPGNDVASGGPGIDRLVGGDGADELSGDDGDDLLEGGPGNDTLLGGPGMDTLLCGDGVDHSDDDGDLDSEHHCELPVT